MNVLMINGSPNAKGCTATALQIVADALHKEDIQTQTIHVGHLDIRGCIGCRKCKTAGKYVFDDRVNETAPLLQACDGLVVGSPVYYASANGSLVSFLNRLFYSTPGSRAMKVGAAVVSARRAGTTATFDQLNKYFTISGMPIASSRYWNMVHGYKPEDVYADEEGCQIMKILGQNMAFLIKSIALGREKYGLPESEEVRFTNFIR